MRVVVEHTRCIDRLDVGVKERGIKDDFRGLNLSSLKYGVAFKLRWERLWVEKVWGVD